MRRCGETTAQWGTPCANPVVRGSDRCAVHGGGDFRRVIDRLRPEDVKLAARMLAARVSHKKIFKTDTGWRVVYG